MRDLFHAVAMDLSRYLDLAKQVITQYSKGDSLSVIGAKRWGLDMAFKLVETVNVEFIFNTSGANVEQIWTLWWNKNKFTIIWNLDTIKSSLNV